MGLRRHGVSGRKCTPLPAIGERSQVHLARSRRAQRPDASCPAGASLPSLGSRRDGVTA